ncbi:hypothetical protein IID24_05815 [Patescibacteria group bacterium]|nr:hypothetical protein [Patescibacteria group bacterium]
MATKVPSDRQVFKKAKKRHKELIAKTLSYMPPVYRKVIKDISKDI